MSQMFQFHTRVVSGTLGRMPLYSFLFQTQCEVFNFNILCNYNVYKAYTILICPHLFLELGRFPGGKERLPCFLTPLETSSKKAQGCREGDKAHGLWAPKAGSGWTMRWVWYPFLQLVSAMAMESAPAALPLQQDEDSLVIWWDYLQNCFCSWATATWFS